MFTSTQNTSPGHPGEGGKEAAGKCQAVEAAEGAGREEKRTTVVAPKFLSTKLMTALLVLLL